MSYPGATSTKFGRYAVAEPFRAETFHLFKGDATTLKTVDHEPPIPVLDQEDLLAQGIHTSRIVRGAPDVDALGSCTCQAGTASLSERVQAATGALPRGLSVSGGPGNEKYAIELYHAVTDQTGDPSQEWPPTDCGSTGLYVCQELIHQGLVKSYLSASDIHSLVSLLQAGTVIMGAPWFNSWMRPGADAFVDGDGSVYAFEQAMRSGVAGGHETCIAAVETLAFNSLGMIDPDKSTLRVRNSWSAAWGDHGSYRIHLSTLQLLGGNADFKQFQIT